MATVQRPGEQYVEFDEYIDYQLDKARNGIKWTDILAAAAGVAALLIGYLVLFVVADHWLFEGGVPRTLRLAMFFIVLVIAAGWVVWRVVWPYVRRVNDLYAARMLEQSEPDLRGSLVGLVDSRRAGRAPAEEVRRALEKHAATTLSSVDVDTALDRRPLMRTSYILLSVVLIACAYAVLSPKRVGPSLLRAMVPTTAVGVATRTEIIEVRPGDASVLAGTELEISVMIRGAAPGQVTLFYSTADRRFADEPIEMRLEDETTREYQAVIVGDVGRGLTQDLSYRIVANDDAAGPFAVTVEQPPAASVESVALQYPAYTGREPSERDTPPIDAIEGTNVALKARANRPLKSAKLVFADDERFLARGEEVPLRIGEDKTTLTASWQLAIRSDGSSPTFYRIECRDTEGKTNPNPAVYPIAIRADLPPEVTLHDPKSDLERPANAIIPLLISARDPDFRLRELTLRLEKRGQELPERTVLWEGSQAEATVRYDWDLAPLGLKPGEVLTFYVQARDNREPEFNRRNTPKLNITIAEPVAQEQVEQQAAEDRKRQDAAEAERNAAAADRAEQPERADADPLDGEQTPEPAAEQGERDPASAANNGQRENESPQPGEPQESSGGDERNAPVKNDGSQDDEVLRKMIQRQREQQKNEQEQDSKQPEETQSSSEQSQDGQRQDDRGQAGQASDSRQPGGEGSAQQPAESDNQGQPSGQQPSETTGTGSQQNAGSSSNDGMGDPQAGDQTAGQPNGSADGQTKPGEEDGPPGGTPDELQGEGGQETTGSQTDSSPQTDSNKSGGTDEPTGSKSPANGDPGPDGLPQEAAQSSPDGQRTGEQPRPAEGGQQSPTASDGERMPSEPGQPRPQDAPPAATDRNPGEGNPDQRSQKPDSGEGGVGQPNADGTPDGRSGPGDAGTQPGSQQAADRQTGQPSEQGRSADRPGNSDQPQPGNPDQGMNAQPSNGQPGGEQPGGEQSPSRSDPSEGQSPSGQRGGQSDSQPSQGQSGENQSTGPQGESAGQRGGQSGQRGQQGEQGQQGESPAGTNGQREDGQGEDGERPSGGQDGQKGDQSQNGGAPMQQQGGQQGQEGGQQGQEGGQQGQPGGQQGDQQGQQGGQQGQQGGQSGGQQGQAGQGTGQNPGNGGASGERASGTAGGGTGGTADGPEATNQDYAKQATDLVLKRLQDDLRRGEVDPELLKELGWTEQDMQRFAKRLRQNLAEPTGGETPQEIARRKEFQHMLENLRIGNGPGAREARTDRVRNVEGVGTVNPAVPSEYRDAFEAFTRSVAGGRNSTDGRQD